MDKLQQLSRLYGAQSFLDAAAIARSFKDEGGIILARNLEHVSSEVFEQQYPELTFLNQGITVNNEGGYSKAITKLKISAQGGFRMVGDNTDTTGKITLGGESDTINVFSKKAESDWSLQELRTAELEGRNLPQEFLRAHNELYQRELDALGYLGQGSTLGLLNRVWASDTSAGAAEALDGDALYEEISNLIVDHNTKVFNNAIFSADRVVMPIRVYNQIARKIMNSAAGPMTVLTALRTNFPEITFGATYKAESVVVDDEAATSVTVAFSSNRQGMQMRIPVPLEISNIFNRGFRYEVESFFGAAGLDVVEEDTATVLLGL